MPHRAPQEPGAGYVIMPAPQLDWLIQAATAPKLYRVLDQPIVITVRRLPEGVFLATSDDLPGLIVETETRDEVIVLARDLAVELLELEGQRPSAGKPRFAFIFEQ